MVLISHPESDTTMSVTRVKRIALLKAVIRASLIDRTCGEPRTAVARGDFPPWCGVCGQMVHPSCTIVKPKETTRRTKPTEGTTTIQASKAERSNDTARPAGDRGTIMGKSWESQLRFELPLFRAETASRMGA